LKALITEARLTGVQTLIVITDVMTPQAVKHMAQVENLRLTHFTYKETAVKLMASHMKQPLVFRALEADERAAIIQQQPQYEAQLFRYPVDDSLVKYYGMKVGDIIYIEDNDRQTGVSKDYALVVENL
jgi:DNA-directed RNA polymerase subunit H (RpoH/RPB5)